MAFELSVCTHYVLLMYSESERESLLSGLATQNVTLFLPFLNEVKWTQEVTKSLQNSIFNGPQIYYCVSDVEVSFIPYDYVIVEQFKCLIFFIYRKIHLLILGQYQAQTVLT